MFSLFLFLVLQIIIIKVFNDIIKVFKTERELPEKVQKPS